ncbi:hypothetical protein ED733_002544 [Metarhizium rileyi]|uniref:Uncharacterized protein n=1 Tax=Metarhizium rileyi (strain RCEF 4871) TaxID=1649241 RepID=A0A5C6G3N3_METRR|nr:hypothetical protein ED733_002544 [Metarhizium rileyi]
MLLPTRGYSLVLFDVDVSAQRKTKDTQDYLSRCVIQNNKNFFFVPWNYAVLTAPTRPPADFSNCCLNGQPYDGKGMAMVQVKTYGESLATMLLEDAGTHNPLPNSVLQGMFLLSDESKAYLGQKFSELFRSEWKIKVDDSKTSTILVVDRDTGCQPEGAYPELDTGNGILAIREIVNDMMNASPPGHPRLNVISCGNKGESSGTGIGQYWTKLPKLTDIPNPDVTKPVTKRDVEAYFLYWASQEDKSKQYFKMVIGLRSGVIDLFTFLGIPTVSIGLRNMVGESRHRRLCGPNFKRLNVQYDRPRHSTTAYVEDRYDNRKAWLNCPFWLGNAPAGSLARDALADDQQLRARTSLPRPFYEFDTFVLTVGVRLACQRYMSWSTTVTKANGSFPDVVTTRDARFCYLAEEKGSSVKQKLMKRKSMDRAAINAMRGQLGNTTSTLQLSDYMFNRFYAFQFGKDWNDIERNIP